MMDTLGRLEAMSEADLRTPGVWSTEYANQRCSLYASLIAKLIEEGRAR